MGNKILITHPFPCRWNYTWMIYFIYLFFFSFLHLHHFILSIVGRKPVYPIALTASFLHPVLYGYPFYVVCPSRLRSASNSLWTRRFLSTILRTHRLSLILPTCPAQFHLSAQIFCITSITFDH